MTGEGRQGGSAARNRTATWCLLVVLASFPGIARAETIETEHLFGFTIGSDIGDVGEKEFEGSATGRFSKRNGTYDAGSGTISRACRTNSRSAAKLSFPSRKQS